MELGGLFKPIHIQYQISFELNCVCRRAFLCAVGQTQTCSQLHAISIPSYPCGSQFSHVKACGIFTCHALALWQSFVYVVGMPQKSASSAALSTACHVCLHVGVRIRHIAIVLLVHWRSTMQGSGVGIFHQFPILHSETTTPAALL